MKLIGLFIYILTKVVYKKRWVILQTFPEFDDNIIILEKMISKLNVEKIIILIPNYQISPNKYRFSEKTIFIKRKSFKGVYYYVFSKFVFITHGLYFWKYPANQISVNIWHGMPLKRIGVETKKNKSGIRTTYTLSTSSFFNQSLSKAFNVDISSIIPINLPRNFFLLENSRQGETKKYFLELNNNILVWLPTYRTSVVGDIRIDGTDYGNVVNLPNFSAEMFNEFLSKNKLICYIKPHPMAKAVTNLEFSNVKIINDNWLSENGFTLYELIAQSDLLISDISSVVVDYLILNKPIIFSFADFSSYRETRGFTNEFFFQNLPGEFCRSYSELENSIKNFTRGKDEYATQRKKIANLFHESYCRNQFDQFITSIFLE